MTNESSLPLLPCPFCGSTEVEDGRPSVAVSCAACSAWGPETATYEHAVELWNRRVNLPHEHAYECYFTSMGYKTDAPQCRRTTPQFDVEKVAERITNALREWQVSIEVRRRSRRQVIADELQKIINGGE